MRSGYYPTPHRLHEEKGITRNDKLLYWEMAHKAEYCDNEICGQLLHRGDLLTTNVELAAISGLSEQEVKTSLKHLQSHAFILNIKPVKLNAGVKGQRKIITLDYDANRKETRIETGLSEYTNCKAPCFNRMDNSKDNCKPNHKEMSIEADLNEYSNCNGNYNDNCIDNRLLNNLNKENKTDIFDEFPEMFDYSLYRCFEKVTPTERTKLLHLIGANDLKLVALYVDQRQKPARTSCSMYDTILNYWRNGYVNGTSTYKPKSKKCSDSDKYLTMEYRQLGPDELPF